MPKVQNYTSATTVLQCCSGFQRPRVFPTANCQTRFGSSSSGWTSCYALLHTIAWASQSFRHQRIECGRYFIATKSAQKTHKSTLVTKSLSSPLLLALSVGLPTEQLFCLLIFEDALALSHARGCKENVSFAEIGLTLTDRPDLTQAYDANHDLI